MDYITIILLLFIILKQFIMSEDLNQIKDDLLAANQTITTAAETAVKSDSIAFKSDKKFSHFAIFVCGLRGFFF